MPCRTIKLSGGRIAMVCGPRIRQPLRLRGVQRARDNGQHQTV